MLKAIGALTSLRTAIHFSDPDSPRTKRYKVDSSVTVTEVSPGTQATRQVDSSEPNSLTGNFIIKSLCEELARIQERLRILEQRELERERRRLDEEKWYVSRPASSIILWRSIQGVTSMESKRV